MFIYLQTQQYTALKDGYFDAALRQFDDPDSIDTWLFGA